MILVYLLTVLVGLCLILCLLRIQVIQRDFWKEKSESYLHEKITVVTPAIRGNIYSSDGQILATTVPVCDLYFDFASYPKRDAKGDEVEDSTGKVVMEATMPDSLFYKYLDEVCQILHESSPKHPASEYKNLLLNEFHREKRRGFIPVQKEMSYSYWAKICEIPGWKRCVVKLDGNGNEVKRTIRAHTYGNMARNVIGFSNGWNNGGTYTGLEGAYDSILRGKDGNSICRRLTRGIWIPVSVGRLGGRDSLLSADSIHYEVNEPAIDGSHIVSTIDTRFQDIAEGSLRKVLSKWGTGTSGCAILMEIETGHVLACANLAWDTFYRQFREIPSNNIAVSQNYEPGSIFKSVILTAIFNDTLAKIDTAMIVPTGIKNFPGGVIDDGHGRGDSVSLKRAFAKSSNVGMCEVAWLNYRNNHNKLLNNVKSFFPYDILHVDLKVPEKKGHWNDLSINSDFSHFCYGYTTNMSALQILTFYNAIGGGGRMVKPMFCKAIIRDGKVEEIPTTVLNPRICSPETAAKMKDLLVGVVENGTGNNIKNNTYGIAGKTGTAWSDYSNHQLYNASFAGFFPAESPKYSCIVVVKRTPAAGRQAAAPIFKDIADCVMAVDKELGYIKIKQRDKSEILLHPSLPKAKQSEVRKISELLGLPYYSKDSSSMWVVRPSAYDTLKRPVRYEPYQLPKGVVPDCTGMTAKDAIGMLKRLGYRVKLSGYGKVTSQSPKARSSATKGSTVNLTLR